MGRSNPFFIALPVNPDSSPNDAPGVRALAERVLAGLDRDRVSIEATRFLEFVAAGKGIECGQKGHLLTWGYVSNHGDAGKTVLDLYPFWKELWRQEDGPDHYETVLVACQDEEAGEMKFVRVSLDQHFYEHGQIYILTDESQLDLAFQVL